MKTRLHAAKTISERMLFEMFIHPWFYLFLTLTLLSGLSVILMFLQSIGSSGVIKISLGELNNPYIEFLLLSFGSTFLEKLFREGPFFFALCYSSYPVFLYLSMSTAFKFGYEKNVGAFELISYGPADGTSCFMAFLIRNTVVTLFMFIILFLFFSLSAILNNLVLGYTFFYALLLLFFFFIAMHSYVIFSSSLSNSAASALAISIIFYIIFFSLQIGVFQIMQKDVRYYSLAISGAVQWISPVYYWYRGMEAVEYGNIPGYFLYLLILLLLSFLLLLASHFIIKKKGVYG
ncbi:MAG: hypothetical protein JXB88_19200 [Spirochaetales bacterium]|nr:hypothetical protein [Spirochaetales bacterium]